MGHRFSWLGVFLLLAGCFSGGFLFFLIWNAQIDAAFNTAISDTPTEKFERIDCPLLLGGSESANVAVRIANPTGETLVYSVGIAAVGFRLAPVEPAAEVAVPGGQTAEAGWTVTPMENGYRAIIVQAVSSKDAAILEPFHPFPTSYREVCGVLVTGLPLTGAQTATVILVFLLAGFILLVPWNLEKLRGRLFQKPGS